MDTRIFTDASEHQAARTAESAHATTTNRLLTRLPQDERDRLLPLFERVNIARKQVLHHRYLPMEHVYFIESGLISRLIWHFCKRRNRAPATRSTASSSDWPAGCWSPAMR
jgi:hypothetical protein